MFEIEQNRLWIRLRKLFNWKNIDQNKSYFAESIQPTFSINPKPSVGYLRQTFDISAADQTIYACPTGMITRIKAFYRAASTATTTVTVGSTSVGAQINAGTSSYQGFMDLLMLPGMILQAKSTGNGADNAIYFSILYEVEPLYLCTGAATYGTTVITGEYPTGTG